MAEGNKTGTDLLGLAAYGEAINTVTKGVVDGAGAFLSRICLPVSEEFGLLLRDKVANWRARNAAKMLEAAEILVGPPTDGASKTAHPRLVHIAVQEASWTDNDQLQNMWAGLLASSCSSSSPNEDNLLLMNILKQLTAEEVIMLNWLCEFLIKGKTSGGYVHTIAQWIDRAELLCRSGIMDADRADLILDHLRNLGLMAEGSGFDIRTGNARIWASSTAIALYARCKGHRGRIIDFYEPLEDYDALLKKHDLESYNSTFDSDNLHYPAENSE
ncbi:hypothetical protein EWE75_22955 [Sphingomonas populi]|uniref:DUF4393 domain-containing protein n=1 Tax=Sphingomonas populi TaxID=2484750 RepID=A0A4V2DBU4_9SPHN|nr:hypothetical protein [Sphingomonas populi]RZF59198.1 hypothetical protein EWE75_22955 [Sphingomonas populi]